MLTEVIASQQPRMYLGNCYRSLPIFMIHAIVVRLYIA